MDSREIVLVAIFLAIIFGTIIAAIVEWIRFERETRRLEIINRILADETARKDG